VHSAGLPVLGLQLGVNASYQFFSKLLELQFRGDDFDGLPRAAHKNEFKIHKVPPVCRPLVQELHVIALHQLEAAVKISFDPAVYIGEAVRCHSPALSEAAINRLGIAILEALDHHEEHAALPFSKNDTVSHNIPDRPRHCPRERKERHSGEIHVQRDIFGWIWTEKYGFG
jgi:hypothetical protein